MPEPRSNSPSARPVLVYLVTEDWYFVSHRLPMALAAQFLILARTQFRRVDLLDGALAMRRDLADEIGVRVPDRQVD